MESIGSQNMGSQQSQLPIRLMTEDDIRQFLLIAFEFKLDKESFARPSREMLFRIYNKFSTELKYIVAEQPNLNAAANIDGIELYMDIIPCINLTTDLRVTLRKWDNLRFHINDILEPKRKRTQHFLTVLITLWVYISEEVILRWIDLAKDKNKLHLKERITKCEEELSSTRLSISKLAITISNTEDVVSGYELNLQKEVANKARTRKEELRRAITEKRLARAKKNERKSELKLAANILDGKIADMKSKIAEYNKCSENVRKLIDSEQSRLDYEKNLDEELAQNNKYLIEDQARYKDLAALSEMLAADIKQHESNKRIRQDIVRLDQEISNIANEEKELNIEEARGQEYKEAMQKEYEEKELQIATKIEQTEEIGRFLRARKAEIEESIKLSQVKHAEQIEKIQKELQLIENDRREIILQGETTRQKVQAAFAAFDKNYQESIQIVCRPLNSNESKTLS